MSYKMLRVKRRDANAVRSYEEESQTRGARIPAFDITKWKYVIS